MVTRPDAPRHFLLDHSAKDLQSRQPGQVLDLRLQLLRDLDQRQRHFDRPRLGSERFELRLGLAGVSLIWVPPSGSPLE